MCTLDMGALVLSWNKLRTHEKKYIFFGENDPICDSSRSNQRPLTDQITYITPHERAYFGVTI